MPLLQQAISAAQPHFFLASLMAMLSWQRTTTYALVGTIVSARQNGELERVKFPFLGKNFQVGYFLGSWPSVDFALFTLNLRSRRHKEILAEVGQNLAFNEAPYLGQKLLTVGFGGHKNRRRYMTANEDKDCVVFFERSEILRRTESAEWYIPKGMVICKWL